MRRRLVPLALVGLLGVLAAGGAVLAVSESPTVVSFSAPPGPPAAVTAFRSAVEATLHARSFIVEQAPIIGWYQAPDRTRDGIVGIGVFDISIGSTYYSANPATKSAAGSSPASWFGEVYPKGVFAPTFVNIERRTLHMMLQFDSVIPLRAGYFVRTLISASDLGHFRPSPALVTFVVRTRRGYVTSITSSVHGTFTAVGDRAPTETCRATNCFVASPPRFRTVTVTFRSFNDVPPIDAPPSATVSGHCHNTTSPKGILCTSSSEALKGSVPSGGG